MSSRVTIVQSQSFSYTVYYCPRQSKTCFILFNLLFIPPQIHNLKLQTSQFRNMSRSQSISVQISFIMRMEQASLMAVQNGFFTGWIREAENTMTVQSSISVSTKKKKKTGRERGQWGRQKNLLGTLAGRTHDGHTFGKHDLISHRSMQIPTAQKTGLGRMCVYPATHHQALVIHVIE